MGIFSKLKDLIIHKKTTAEKIKEKNEEASEIKQQKFDEGLHHSSSILNSNLNDLIKKYSKVDQNLIDEIEEFLIKFDIGTNSTTKILDSIVNEIKLQNIDQPELVKQIVIDKLFVYYIQNTDIDTAINVEKGKLNVILVSGVNGVGKTTSIAKLANFYIKKGYKVALVAGDTFRAGAIAQLEIWAERLNVPIFKPQKEGQDPASLVFQSLEYATKNNTDIILCDTSGRLQNKVNLMNELKKIDNIIKRFDTTQPCESLLVIDATTGQNGIMQAKAFNEVTKLTGIILTKMDSSSKGGIILAIKDAFNLPVKFIGFGEKIEDIDYFDLENFISGLTKDLKI